MTDLRVLIVEDRESDARLLLSELESAGFRPDWRRVETERDYRTQLVWSPDLILADYNLPSFGAPRALELLRDEGLEIPFIIVSGTIGEDQAVRAMQQGATDYLLKDRLGRLGQAVTQALAQQELHDAKRRAEAALSAAEARMQQIIQTTPAVIYALKFADASFAPIWISPSVEQLTGFTSEQADARGWWQSRVHPDDLPRACDAATLLETGSSLIEYRFRCRDGTYRWIVDHKRLIRDERGAPVEIVGSWLDITGRKRLEEQFRQAQKLEAIGRLAGGVAHDFNNLLTVILGYSELARDSLEEHDPLRESFDEIIRAGQRGASLTRQLLAFGRKQILQPVVVDLNLLLADMENMLHRLIGEDVDLVIRPRDPLWHVKVDPGQFEQVVMNLAVNARDAMPTGGTLTIETGHAELDEDDLRVRPEARAGQYVLISVADTGCGMDAATRARIFEPFFTTKGFEKGTGLGLATVHGIVNQSGGSVDVHSEPGLGTTFKVYIPRDTSGAAPAPTHDGRPASSRGTETILFVEDEPAMRALSRSALEKYGYTVFEAENAGAALAVVSQAPVDLLITDAIMPGMSGRQLAGQLLPRRPGLKVLLISGYADDAVVRHGTLEPDVAFLQKPFTPEMLAQKVRAVLDRIPEPRPEGQAQPRFRKRGKQGDGETRRKRG